MRSKSADPISAARLPARFRERYQLLEKVGEGGVALVYKVRDLQDDGEKALKILKPSYNEDPKAIDRFAEEFRILRGLHHPSLPAMYDYGVADDGLRCMVMELVEGIPLDRYFKKHRDEVWLLLLEIAAALDFIHQHNLLHLDLKPENILVRRTVGYGNEKPLITLIDFGLSFRRESQSTVKVVGTPAYMAPEIISGTGRITRAVDYYSFGITLFELLEGKVPFHGTLEEILQAHLHKQATFSQELLEYAELYPRVKGLLGKAVGERLDAFDDLMRNLHTRAGSELEGLTRAYSMGFVDSLGMIGKAAPMEQLHEWVQAIVNELGVRRQDIRGISAISEAVEDSGGDVSMSSTRSSTKLLGSTVFSGESTELDKRIKIDLFGAAKRRSHAAETRRYGPISSAPRVMAISGPSGSGKSYCVDAVTGEGLLDGMRTIILGEGGDYEALVSDEKIRKEKDSPVDPRSLIIDRFVRGWERLEEAGKQGGALLVLDGFDTASKEQREFLEYVGKRVALITDEEREPGIFLVVTGKSTRLKSNIRKLMPKEISIDGVVVPLPGSEDVEEIVGVFHGHMAGVDDRKRLRNYLLAHSESSGALTNALRAALVRGGLELKAKQWRFSEGVALAETSGATEREYYRELLHELAAEERKLIAWLSCHRGWLDVQSFLAISNFTEQHLNRLLEKLSPYRIVDSRDDSKHTYVGITSENVRKAIYQLLDKKERVPYHNAYVEYFKRKKQDPVVNEAMAFHYDGLGDVRRGLIMRIRALRMLKANRDIFGIRRICEQGISIVSKLRAKRWKDHKWHLERYFIKQLIEAEWMVSNFKGLIDVIEMHIKKKKRELPLSFVYIYGMALRSVGEFKACGKLVKESKKYSKRNKLNITSYAMLLEAALLNNIGLFNKSIELLDNIEAIFKEVPADIQCRKYLYYLLNYDELGEVKKSKLYIEKALVYARKNNFYDEYYFAKYYEILSMFNRSLYSRAKKELIPSIKATNQLKLYFRLGNMYHLLSGVYFEEGKYYKAIKYLDKATTFGTKLGMISWVNSCYMNYSYIYEHMGYYLEAKAYAQLARKTAFSKDWKGTRFVSLVQLFYLSVITGGAEEEIMRHKLEKHPKINISQDHIAQYYYVTGIYYLSKEKYAEAEHNFKTACDLFKTTKLQDDVVRSQLKLFNVSILTRDYKNCAYLIQYISKQIKEMESPHLTNEYNYLVMYYYYVTGNRRMVDKLYEKIQVGLKNVNDVRLFLDVCELIIKINIDNNISIAKKYFRRYYEKMKVLANHVHENDLIKMKHYRTLLDLTKMITAKK